MMTPVVYGALSVLKDEQVVAGCNGDDVVRWMPCRVQDLLPEVQAVHTDIVLPPLLPHTHAARPEHRTPLTHLPARLQSHVTPTRSVKHPKEIIICPCHDDTERERDKEGGMRKSL